MTIPQKRHSSLPSSYSSYSSNSEKRSSICYDKQKWTACPSIPSNRSTGILWTRSTKNTWTVLLSVFRVCLWLVFSRRIHSGDWVHQGWWNTRESKDFFLCAGFIQQTHWKPANHSNPIGIRKDHLCFSIGALLPAFEEGSRWNGCSGLYVIGSAKSVFLHIGFPSLQCEQSLCLLFLERGYFMHLVVPIPMHDE